MPGCFVVQTVTPPLSGMRHDFTRGQVKKPFPLGCVARYRARMGQIVNMNRFHKQKSRAEARRQGDANAAKFGRSKAERQAATEALTRAARQLDGHRRETPPTGDDG